MTFPTALTACIESNPGEFSWAWLDTNLTIKKFKGRILESAGLTAGDTFPVNFLMDFVPKISSQKIENFRDLQSIFSPVELTCKAPNSGGCKMKISWCESPQSFLLIMKGGKCTTSWDDILFDVLSHHEQEICDLTLQKTNPPKTKKKYTRIDQLACRETKKFVSSAAHDLKSPLRAIQSFSTWALEEVPEDVSSEFVEYLRQIQRHAQRATHLVSDIYQYLQVGQHAEPHILFNLKNLLEEAVASAAIPDRVDVRVECTNITVSAPQQAMHGILVQLLDNTVKHCGQDMSLIQLRASTDNHNIVLEVVDDGPGIASRHHDQIFEPFEKLESYDDAPGSGLGLASVKKLLAVNGASIDLTSPYKNDRGAMFRSCWPKTQTC